ncbi:acyl-CoA dehydrogenase family protein [Nocardia sp. NPDC050630]|uniref:acyl-CoA dehydrogenase family protein n=1 Tax=Nocardia sp. NPDC050630 TaxID=3364321 RepID=UPI0037AF50AF
MGGSPSHGRCVGIARACLAEAAAHAATRAQGGASLAEHQLIHAALGRYWVDIEGAQAICERTTEERIGGHPVENDHH